MIEKIRTSLCENLAIIIIILIILGFVAPTLSFAQINDQTVNYLPGAPETLKEAKDFVIKILKGLPGTLKDAWQEALEIWKKMAGWAKGLWKAYIGPKIQALWQKIKTFFSKEIEKRKPIIEEELKKEKEEMKEEIKTGVPKIGKSLWERFKELIK